MKIAILLCISLFSLAAHADQKITPLEIELGYWESTIEIQENKMIRDMLASLPESQREMVRKGMQGAMSNKITKQCVTAESLKSMENQFRESLGSAGKDESCDLNITKSTASEFIGDINCQNTPTVIHTKVINSKRYESDVTSTVSGMGESKVKIIAEWKSATCPAGL